jgi:tetratricopeptide (TPR) repeat protein
LGNGKSGEGEKTGKTKEKKDREELMIRFWVVFSLLIMGCTLKEVKEQVLLTPEEEEAYQFNRTGMIDMSMALFEEAIVAFKKASQLAQDYQIRDQSLMYTPTFMTAWSYEKIGEVQEACRYFREFLQNAPKKYIEDTKEQHANAFLTQCIN